VGSAMGMRTVAFRASGAPISGVDVVTDDLPTALASGDFIVSVLPSTPATVGLLSGSTLKACAPRQPVFINVCRKMCCQGQASQSSFVCHSPHVLRCFSCLRRHHTGRTWRHRG